MIEDISGVYVISDKYEGTIIPKNIKSLDTTFHLQDNYWINGSIYGRDILIKGPGFIDGSIAAAREIKISRESVYNKYIGKFCLITGGLTSGQAIFVDFKDKLSIPYIFINGDVNSPRINLKNSIILGNICGETVLIENCIVFGAIYTKNLILKNSSIMTFHCEENAEIIGKNTLFTPYASAKLSITFKNSGKSDAEFRFFPFCYCNNDIYGCGNGLLFCKNFNNSTCQVYVKIEREDILNAKIVEDNEEKNIRYISLSSKFFMVPESKYKLEIFYKIFMQIFIVKFRKPAEQIMMINEFSENRQYILGMSEILKFILNKNFESYEELEKFIDKMEGYKPNCEIEKSRIDGILNEIENSITELY